MTPVSGLVSNAQAFGKYQLLKKLATGGMAEVWLARQTGIEGFQRLLVVKRILPHLADDPEFVQMFLNEAKIAARFSHPNIAQIFDLGEMNGTYFIAMEFVHGEDLGRVMRKAWSSGQWIARPLSIRIVAGACEGLHYAHIKQDDTGRPLKVVHRDISPQNILISFDGSVKLVDFGIAKAADQASLTKSGAIKGKFAYMSPEQAAGKPLDHRSDLFSVGLVLYELLTGVRPLKRDSELATLQAALECNIEPPSKVADVPEDLDPVVMKALAKSADDRYRDARAFQMALEEVLVSQRWVASSVQLSELMSTLFADRIAEEAKLGHPDPESHDPSAPSGSPAAPAPPEESTNSISHTEDGGPQARAERPAGSDDISWDAPPGETHAKELARVRAARGQRGNSGGRKSVPGPAAQEARGRTPAPGAPPPDVPDWDAPSAVEKPQNGQRPSTRGATAVARSSSRPEVPRARSSDAVKRPPKLVIEGEQSSEAPPSNGAPLAQSSQITQMPRRRSSADVRKLEAEPTGDLHALQDVEPPKRRPTSGSRPSATPARRISSKSLPAQPQTVTPARARWRDEVEPELEQDDVQPTSGLEKREPAWRERLKDWRTLPLRQIIGAVAALIIALTCWVKWDSISAAMKHRGVDGQAIFLDVNSNRPVHVLVKHRQGDGSLDPVTELGDVPLVHVPGAHVRDTLILKLEQQDIYYEQDIPFGEPGQTVQIQHDFHIGYYELNLKPKDLHGIRIHLNTLNGAQIGTYPPAVKLELVEGTHKLVMEGDQLNKPAEIDIEVKRDQTIRGKPFDLGVLMGGETDK
jgi:serine/threonine protein kinase